MIWALFATFKRSFNAIFLALAVVEVTASLTSVNSVYAHLEKKSTPYISVELQYEDAAQTFFVSTGIGQNRGALDDVRQTLQLTVSNSAYTWVPGPLPAPTFCDNSYLPSTPDNKFYYCRYSNDSSTYNPLLSSTFSNSSNTTFYGRNYTIGDYSTYFAEIDYFATDKFKIGLTAIDGIAFGISSNFTLQPSIGLGIAHDAEQSLPPSIFSVMLRQNVVGLAAYSVYLNDFDYGAGANVDVFTGADGAQLFIGSVDTTKYEGDLVTFDADRGEVIGVTSVIIRRMSIVGSEGKATALLKDSFVNIAFSESLIYVPQAQLDTLVKVSNAVFDELYEGYLCDCGQRWSNISMVFEFPGLNITIDAHQFIVPAVSFSGATYPPGEMYSAILGTPFVRGAYVIHDFTNNQTSLAPARLNNTGEALIIPLAAGGVNATFNSTTTSTTTSTTASPTNSPTTTTTTTSEIPPNSKPPIGAIVGGVIGGVVLISAMIALLIVQCRRRNKGRESHSDTQHAELDGKGGLHELAEQVKNSPAELAVDPHDRKAVNEHPVELDSTAYVRKSSSDEPMDRETATGGAHSNDINK